MTTHTLSARADVVEGRGASGLEFSTDQRTRRTVPRGIVDSPPEFALIPKEQLAVDHDYQRGLSTKRIREGAANWSWAACGGLKVALRPSGDWYVFDGQHRLAMAMLREDVTALPCLIYEMETVVDEAVGFLSQTSAKPMSVVDRFRAMLIARDPTALIVKGIMDSEKLTLRAGVKPGDRAMGCAAELLKWAREDPAALRRLFPILSGIINRGGMVSDRILRGLMHLEQRIAGGSLTEKRWRARIATLSYQTLTDAISSSCALEGNGNARACALGILSAINRGLKNRLLVPGINS